MANESTKPEGFSLRRWSRRKRDVAREAAAAQADAARVAHEAPAGRAARGDGADPNLAQERGSVAAAAAGPVAQPRPRDASADSPPALDPYPGGAPSPTAATPRTAAGAAIPALPPVDTLTIDSDFTPFMQSGVDESMRRDALKKLFNDARFNVMDGLDVYIDDYSKPDPIDPAIVRTLMQARYIFNPPATRVTAEGYVEDVPDHPDAAAPLAQPADAAAAETAAGDAAASGIAAAEANVPVAANAAVATVEAAPEPNVPVAANAAAATVEASAAQPPPSAASEASGDVEEGSERSMPAESGTR